MGHDGTTSKLQANKYVRPFNTRTEIYAGRVACCPLVSHVEYAPRALLQVENKNSSGDEIANVNFLRRYGTYVLQNTKKENLLRLTN